MKSGVTALLLCSAALSATIALPVQSLGQTAAAARPLYKDPSASVDARVNDLLSRMTLEEKVAQIMTVWDSKAEVFNAAGEFDAAKMSTKFPNGIGQFARPSDATGPASPRKVMGRDVRGTVRLVNALQRHAMTKTRLGIPILMHEEGLHGYAALGATSFPQAIALASSWDPALLRDINVVIGREIRARGVSLALSPVVDVARDPRWGRIEETFGEDPYLASEMGVAAVEGLQGTGKATTLGPGKVFATLKHLTGHGQPESGTNVGPANISERALREYFFPPFEQVVKRTGIQAVMASYNEIDGVPSHASKWLLGDILRGEWGFKGAVVSDYYAIDELAGRHGIATDKAAAALLALAAGVDSDLPTGAAYSTLLGSVRDGKVPEAAINQAVGRMLALKFRAGLFENPYADAEAAVAVTNNADARALALKSAQRSIILLKNDGVLPLSAPESRAKMQAGIALSDLDRWPWLDRIAQTLAAETESGEVSVGKVAACSALKRAYRDRIRATLPDVTFVFLDGESELIRRRMASRTGHFMRLELLDSQLRTLERPAPDETDVVTLNVDRSVEEMVSELTEILKPMRFSATNV